MTRQSSIELKIFLNSYLLLASRQHCIVFLFTDVPTSNSICSALTGCPQKFSPILLNYSMTVLLITISIPVFLQRVVESEDESEQEEVSGSEPDSRAQGVQNCNAAEPESDFEMPEDDENDVDFTYAAMEESTESESNGEEDPEEHANEIM